MNTRHAAHVQRMVDAVLELTLSAVIGAGQARLERGLAALKGAADAAHEA